MTNFPADKRFATIYADPPWPERSGGKIIRGANRHYSLMSVGEIADRAARGPAADNAHLYLWTTNNYPHDAIHVMEAWGFRYITTITWAKERFGLGQYYRGQTEHCLFGVRGRLPYKVIDGKRQQGTTLLSSPRREHSRKPDELRTMIERVSYPPYIELFARSAASGCWDTWGNQVGYFDPG